MLCIWHHCPRHDGVMSSPDQLASILDPSSSHPSIKWLGKAWANKSGHSTSSCQTCAHPPHVPVLATDPFMFAPTMASAFGAMSPRIAALPPLSDGGRALPLLLRKPSPLNPPQPAPFFKMP
eukprot:637146-Rhodomonas_salina.1